MDYVLEEVLDAVPHDRTMQKFSVYPTGKEEDNFYEKKAILKDKSPPAFNEIPDETNVKHYRSVKVNGTIDCQSEDLRSLTLYPPIEYLMTLTARSMRDHQFKGIEWNKTDRI